MFSSCWKMVTVRKIAHLFPVLEYNVKDRESFFKTVASEKKCSRAEAKSITLAAGFHCSLKGEPSNSILVALRDEMRSLAQVLSSEKPGHIKIIAEEWNKRRPSVTLLTYNFLHIEGEERCNMKAAVPSIMCPEADGIVVVDVTAEQDVAIRGSTFMQLVIKPYPADHAAFITYAKGRKPGFDWDSSSKYKWADVQRAYKFTYEVLHMTEEERESRELCPALYRQMLSAHDDFALVLAASAEDHAIVMKTDLHFYDASTGAWVVTDLKKFPNFVRNLISTVYGKRNSFYSKGKLHSYVYDVPLKCKQHSWLGCVRAELQSYLVDKPPVYNKNRDLLLFSDGNVYHFPSLTWMHSEAWWYLERRMPFAVQEWKHGTAWRSICDEIFRYYKTNVSRTLSGDKEPLLPFINTYEEIAFGNPEIERQIRDFVVRDPCALFLFDVCKQDCNDFVYLLLHICRMTCSCQRFCEFLFFHGSAKTGKDALASLLEKYFGNSTDEHGFCAGTPAGFFLVNNTSRNSEECSPFEAGLRDAKCIVVPEVGTGKLNMNVLKPLCEQSGAKTTTRGRNKDPERSNPTYEICMFSNNAPSPDSGDSGSRRRTNVFYMRNKFTAVPQEGEQAARDSIKESISSGSMNNSLWHLVINLHDCLQLWNTNIPRTYNVHEATLEVFSDLQMDTGEDDPFAAWMNRTFRATSVADACVEKVVKTMCRNYWKCRLSEVSTMMRDHGIALDNRVNSKRYVRYKFDSNGESMPVGLK